ncbi:MAG: leucine-rich repeat domain-containing protein [Aeriscardovia sp.]|nr:leucine-rich repeat domain-containing protein [Aeriscardovia sp.]
MQKIKLLLLLTLLCVGVSESWARTYTVQYVGVPSGQTGDFQITNPWVKTNYTNWYVRLQKSSSTSLTATEYYYNNGWSAQNDDSEDMENIHYYIRPLTIDGYDATVSSSYNNRRITITYTRSSVVKWHDDIFEYSTRHTQATGNVQDLPANEVSISLWLGRNENEFEEITDTISFFGPLWNNASVGQTQTLPDYYSNDVTATASYKYLGRLTNYTPSTGTYFYLRTRTIPISTVTDVVIPKEKIYNGTTYKVTAIQKWGFCYIASDCNPRYVCDEDDYDQWKGQGDQEESLINAGLADYDYGNINDHRNDYLVNVRFESPSNVTQIGDYAFMSNRKLKSIIVPNTITVLGQGVWECCRALTDLRFQTRDDGTVGFNTIRNFTFWYCTALETLVLPEGITTIEGAAVGAPLQYMFSLIDLKLPNSLTSIGAHFVCCCNSLETLTIPAGVTDISGACFHGCESLTTVYLLGTAGSLAGSSGGGNTFGLNEVFCRDHVSNCTFYTTADYIASYAQGEETSVWYQIADNRDSEGYLIDENGNRIQVSQVPNLPVLIDKFRRND